MNEKLLKAIKQGHFYIDSRKCTIISINLLNNKVTTTGGEYSFSSFDNDFIKTYLSLGIEKINTFIYNGKELKNGNGNTVVLIGTNYKVINKFNECELKIYGLDSHDNETRGMKPTICIFDDNLKSIDCNKGLDIDVSSI